MYFRSLVSAAVKTQKMLYFDMLITGDYSIYIPILLLNHTHYRPYY